MNNVRYELQTYQDPEYPLIFHYDHLQSPTMIMPHWHMNLELLYIQRGTICVTLESGKIVASRGQIVVINANVVHSIESLTQESYYFCLIIDSTFAQKLGFDVINTRYKSLTDDLEMKNIFQLIINEGTLQKAFYKKAIRALCHTMLILLHRNQIFTQDESISNEYFTYENVNIVKRILRYIQTNYSRDFTLDDLANIATVSKFHMCRVFKEITLITINQYIIQVRLERAKELLIEDSMSISDIAESCGFANVSYFTKTYKKHYGHSPSQSKKYAPQFSKEIYEVNLSNPVESTKDNSVLVSKFI